MLKNIEKTLREYGKKVIDKAKSNLASKDNTGTLSNSLYFEVKDVKTDEPKGIFFAEDYGNFVDLGVQGNDPQAMPKGSKIRYNRAPNSPYQFGTGRGKKGLRKSINTWVTQRGSFKIRDDKGRFIQRKSLVYLITRSIWYTGIKPSYFFTNAQNEYGRQLVSKLGKAFVKDGVDLINSDLRGLKNIKVK